MQNKGFWMDAEEPTSQKRGYRDSTDISYDLVKEDGSAREQDIQGTAAFPHSSAFPIWKTVLPDRYVLACLLCGTKPEHSEGKRREQVLVVGSSGRREARGPAPVQASARPAPCGQAPGQQSIPERQARWESCCTCSSRSSRPTAMC